MFDGNNWQQGAMMGQKKIDVLIDASPKTPKNKAK